MGPQSIKETGQQHTNDTVEHALAESGHPAANVSTVFVGQNRFAGLGLRKLYDRLALAEAELSCAAPR